MEKAKSAKIFFTTCKCKGRVKSYMTVPKLRGRHNFQQWSRTIRAYLESEDLWCVVSHRQNGTSEQVQKDKRARFVIMSHLENRIFVYMEEMKNAFELWRYVNAAFYCFRERGEVDVQTDPDSDGEMIYGLDDERVLSVQSSSRSRNSAARR